MNIRKALEMLRDASRQQLIEFRGHIDLLLENKKIPYSRLDYLSIGVIKRRGHEFGQLGLSHIFFISESPKLANHAIDFLIHIEYIHLAGQEPALNFSLKFVYQYEFKREDFGTSEWGNIIKIHNQSEIAEIYVGQIFLRNLHK
jgi:hypothetical protein